MPPTEPDVPALQALIEDTDTVDATLDAWLKRFAAVQDRGLRRTVLVEAMASVSDVTLLAILARLPNRSSTGDALCRWMSAEIALTPSVLLDLPYARVQDLYALAHTAGLPSIAARFLPGAVSPQAVKPEGNPFLEISAGERTAKARRGDRLTIDRLMRDRDPRVIRALLDNPILQELDVVRIAANRPTAPAVLETVAAHPRWAVRYRVRKALAFNPCTPPAMTRLLLPTLLMQDLEEISSSMLLEELLREEALRLLQLRARPATAPLRAPEEPALAPALEEPTAETLETSAIDPLPTDA